MILLLFLGFASVWFIGKHRGCLLRLATDLALFLRIEDVFKYGISDKYSPPVPISVNFHFTRKCNKECGFCFHTEKTSHIATEGEMKEGLRLLKAAGMRKVNFAGGEPFLYPKRLGTLCRFAKEQLKLESVSIITNGTKVTTNWLQEHAPFIDVLGVSCDSFDEDTNIAIGRGTGENVTQLFRIRDWCRLHQIKFKLNTVVCKLNWEEDMSSVVAELDQP